MSTKIEDLPDNNNNDTSNQILQELNEDDNESEISEIQVSKKIVVKNSNYIALVKESLIVFSLVFALSNTVVLTAFNQLPYIKTLEPHSLIYNLIIALIAGLLHFIIKYLEIL